MESQLKGEPLATTAHTFIKQLESVRFNIDDKPGIDILLQSLPHIRLRSGYSLGWYREGDFWGKHVHLYPFRTGSTDEYDPGIHNRDIEQKMYLDIMHTFEEAKKGDAEAAEILEQRRNPTPFRDGQVIRCSIMLGADDSVPQLQDYLDIDFTIESVWESLLLLNLSVNYLPHSWHGMYANGELVLAPDDLRKVFRGYQKVNSSVWKPFLTDDRLLPSVTLHNELQATVNVCRWNDWRGLDRLTYHAFRGGRTISFEREDPVNLIEYNCGIHF